MDRKVHVFKIKVIFKWIEEFLREYDILLKSRFESKPLTFATRNSASQMEGGNRPTNVSIIELPRCFVGPAWNRRAYIKASVQGRNSQGFDS